MGCEGNVELSNESAFFGDGNVQHAGAGRKGSHGSRYHSYPIPKYVELNDAVAFSCGGSMQREVQNKCRAVMGDDDALYLFDETGGLDANVSRNSISVERKGGKDGNSATDVCPGYSINAPIAEDENRKVSAVSFRFLSMSIDKSVSKSLIIFCFARSMCRKMFSCEKLKLYSQFQRSIILT